MVKNPHLGSIPGSGRSLGEGNDYPLQYSCLENSMDRKAWWAAIMGSQRVRHDRVTNIHRIDILLLLRKLCFNVYILEDLVS